MRPASADGKFFFISVSATESYENEGFLQEMVAQAHRDGRESWSAQSDRGLSKPQATLPEAPPRILGKAPKEVRDELRPSLRFHGSYEQGLKKGGR